MFVTSSSNERGKDNQKVGKSSKKNNNIIVSKRGINFKCEREIAEWGEFGGKKVAHRQ